MHRKRRRLPALIDIILIPKNAFCHFEEEKIEAGRIKRTDYEVIIAKSVGDRFSYEKPEPLDLLPSEIRGGRLYSVRPPIYQSGNG